MSLILASQSPRRRELLAQLGVSFTIEAADIDETPLANETADDYVARMALEKAQVIAHRYPDCVVLGSDTTVVLGDTILGKPLDREDGIATLLRLADQEHRVLTAVAVIKGSEVWQSTVSTGVVMMPLTRAQAEAYWATGEPADKAGSYGLQGVGGALVKAISGSYSAVIGLPLHETAMLLTDAGVATWLSPAT